MLKSVRVKVFKSAVQIFFAFFNENLHKFIIAIREQEKEKKVEDEWEMIFFLK